MGRGGRAVSAAHRQLTAGLGAFGRGLSKDCGHDHERDDQPSWTHRSGHLRGRLDWAQRHFSDRHCGWACALWRRLQPSQFGRNPPQYGPDNPYELRPRRRGLAMGGRRLVRWRLPRQCSGSPRHGTWRLDQPPLGTSRHWLPRLCNQSQHRGLSQSVNRKLVREDPRHGPWQLRGRLVQAQAAGQFGWLSALRGAGHWWVRSAKGTPQRRVHTALLRRSALRGLHQLRHRPLPGLQRVRRGRKRRRRRQPPLVHL